MNEQMQRDLGRQEAQIEALQGRMERLSVQLSEMDRKVDKLCVAFADAMGRARGGWAVLLAVGTVAAGIGGVVAYVISWLGWVPR